MCHFVWKYVLCAILYGNKTGCFRLLLITVINFFYDVRSAEERCIRAPTVYFFSTHWLSLPQTMLICEAELNVVLLF